MSVRVVVIGGGPAGVMAAIAARRQQADAAVTLVSDEACEPYEKPPLSKAVLLGQAAPGDAPIAGPQGIAAHGVAQRCGMATGIDRGARTVATTAGALPYDTLVLATGSRPRELPLLPAGMPGVFYLRTQADALRLQQTLRAARDVLVVGGGLIGLEVAASAAVGGVRTTVIEMAPRILQRVCDEAIAARVHQAHRDHGVDIRVDATLAEARPQEDGRIAIATSAGERVVVDAVIVGIGVAPDDRLAAAAGLDTRDGIVVDGACRTSDPAIFAAGDAVRLPGPRDLVRLENWRHALEQGAVAGANAAGAQQRYTTVPSFWSEQYDLYIQGVGWPDAAGRRVERRVGAQHLLTFHLDGERLVSAAGINAQRDLAMARRLIERGVAVDAAALADPAQPLAGMLKPRV